jgi:serine/threonine-protein kinase
MGAARYTPLVKIAAGGMATVFVGLTEQGDLVALKRPHEHLVDDERFLRSLRIEVEIGRRLAHPNVVGIEQVVMEHDTMYLVMPYIDGVTLADIARARAGVRLPLRVATRILLDACTGLAFAHDLKDDSGHRLGVVHRDVSPANILVGADGCSRVSDFGIAKAVEQADATTTTGIKGKHAYMAPEYIRGKSLDQRSDVFALGVIVWETLTARRLFRATNDAETIERVLTMQPPLLREIDPALEPFDEVLAHALAKEPDERFVNASAFRGAFEAVASAAGGIGSVEEVRELVEQAVGSQLAKRREAIASARRVAGRTTVTDTLRKPRADAAKTEPGVDRAFHEHEPPDNGTPPIDDLELADPEPERTAATRDLAWKSAPSPRAARPRRWVPIGIAATAAVVVVAAAVFVPVLVVRSKRSQGDPPGSSNASPILSTNTSSGTSSSTSVPLTASVVTPSVQTAHARPPPRTPAIADGGAILLRPSASIEPRIDGGGWHPAPASVVYGDGG